MMAPIMWRYAPRARRAIHRTLEWRPKQLGQEPVDIWSVVSPLRYDVVVRAEFLGLVARHAAGELDFEALYEMALGHPYFVWWEHVAVVRFRPEIAHEEQLLLAAFRKRVLKTSRLWDSFLENGFDPRQPVTLRVARAGTATPQGKKVTQRFYVGDGCHRLALLLASGVRELRPEWYRVDRTPLHVLTDNTWTLVRALALDEQRYCRFLSLAYADQEIESIPALIRHVSANQPARHTELLEVLWHDLTLSKHPRSGPVPAPRAAEDAP